MEFFTEQITVIITFIFSTVVILLSGYTAKKKGLSFILGIIFGLLFNFIGLIVISLLPDKHNHYSKQ